MLNRSMLLTLTAGAALCLAGVAHAQNGNRPARQGDRPAQKQDQKDTQNDDQTLRGPAVDDNSQPGQRGRFGGGQQGQQRDAMIPMRLFQRALNASLTGDSVKPELKLTADQDTAIKNTIAEHTELVEIFRKEYEGEIKDLAKDLPPQERRRVALLLASLAPEPAAGEGRGRDTQLRDGEGRPQRRPGQDRPARDGMDGMDRDGMDMMDGGEVDPAKADAARKRLRELAEAAPKAAEAQKKIMETLSAPQREAVQATLKKAAEGMRNRQGQPGQGRPGMDQIPQEMREKLRDMSPEERREAIRKWRESQPDSAQRPNRRPE